MESYRFAEAQSEAADVRIHMRAGFIQGAAASSHLYSLLLSLTLQTV